MLFTYEELHFNTHRPLVNTESTPRMHPADWPRAPKQRPRPAATRSDLGSCPRSHGLSLITRTVLVTCAVLGHAFTEVVQTSDPWGRASRLGGRGGVSCAVIGQAGKVTEHERALNWQTLCALSLGTGPHSRVEAT